MSMPEGETGEIVRLSWEDPPWVWYVYGHVAFGAAVEIATEEAQQYAEEHADEEVELVRLGEPRYLWAEWVYPDEDEEPDAETMIDFMTYTNQAEGLFPVTAVYDLDALEERREFERRRKEREARVEAAFRALYPEILTIEVSAHFEGDAHVEFTLPGLDGPVGWRQKEAAKLFVRAVDHETMRTVYGGRKYSEVK